MISDKQLQEIEAGADQLIKQGFLSPTKRESHIAQQVQIAESLVDEPKATKKKSKKK